MISTKLWEIILNDPNLKVEIASSRPNTHKIGSSIIMWYQNTNYSHVLVIVNDMVFEASHGMAHIDMMEKFLKENVIVNRIEIPKEKCDFEYLFSTLGNAYGYSQIIEIASRYIFLLKLKLIRKFKYKDNGSSQVICSEYVGKVLRLDWVDDLTSPEEIVSYLLTIKKN